MTSGNICKKSNNALIQHITPCQTELSTIKVNVLCSSGGCGKIFATQSSLRMHMEKVHRQLTTHARGSSSGHWYHCPEKSCCYNIHADSKLAKHFTKMGSLKQHWLKVHAERVLTCPECHSSSFSCQRLLLAHRRSCGVSLHCALCPNSNFTSLEALQSHCRRNQHAPAQHSLIHIKERLQILADESKEKKLLQSSGNRTSFNGQPRKTFSMKLKALDEYISLEKYNSDNIDMGDANLPAVSASMDSRPTKNSYHKTNDGTISFIMLNKDKTVVSQTFPGMSTDGRSFSISDLEKININATATMQQSLTCTPDINITHQSLYCDKAMEITTNRNSQTPSENFNIQSRKSSTKCQDELPGYDKRGGNHLHNNNVASNIINKNNNNLLLHNNRCNLLTGLPSAVNSCCRSTSITENLVRHGSADDVNTDVPYCQCMHNRFCFAGAVNCNNSCKNVIQNCPCKGFYGNYENNESVLHVEESCFPHIIPSNSSVESPRTCLTNHGKLSCRCSRTLLTTCVRSHCYAGNNNIVKGTCYCQTPCKNTSTHLSLHDCSNTSLVNYTAGDSRSCEVATVACCSTRRDELQSHARPPPHLLAAIALSELAAPAIKSVNLEKATQTVTRSDWPMHWSASHKSYDDRGRNSYFEWSGTGADDITENETSFEMNRARVTDDRPVRSVCVKRGRLGERSKGVTAGDISPSKNCKKIYSRAARRRKSAETQTRLTRKEKTARQGFDADQTNRHGRCRLKRSNSNGGSSSKRLHFTVHDNEDVLPKIECVDASINTEDEGADLNRENVCVLDAFPCQTVPKSTERPNSTDTNTSRNCSFYEFECDCEQHTAEKITKISDDKPKDAIEKYVIVENNNSIAVETNTLPLSFDLSSVCVGPLHSNSGTQTSPRAMVSVGIVTCGAIYQDLALALMSERGSVIGSNQGISTNDTDAGLLSIQTSYDIQSDDDKQMCGGNSRIPLLGSGDLVANSDGNEGMHSSMAIGNANTDSRNNNPKGYGDTSEEISADGINVECNSVDPENDNLTSFPTAATSYTNENMLLEDEENYVIVDRNLSEMSTNLDLNSSSENMKATARPARFTRPPKLSDIRSSSIETQTEHDILLSGTRARLDDGLDADNPSSPASRTDWGTASGNLHSVVPRVSAWCTDTENQDSFPAPPSESAWCTIETQTCEDFSDIEQFMCSSTHTQTSEQVRRELFPELSFADTQTQTGHEDLVHSHTQTNF